MSRPKGSKNKPKVDKGTLEVTGLSISASISSSLSKFVNPKPEYDAEKLKDTTIDEPAKYVTAPMSDWAKENRKRKLGLKD